MIAVPIALEVSVEKLIIEKGHNLFQKFMVLWESQLLWAFSFA